MTALSLVSDTKKPLSHNKYETAVVIDDNPMELLVTKTILRKSNFSKKLVAFQYPKKAMAYFKRIEQHGKSNENPREYIILLDLYMPKMDGFQFIEAFEGLNKEFKQQCKIYILSNSTNPMDLLKAKSSKSIYGFISKPMLSNDTLWAINKSC